MKTSGIWGNIQMGTRKEQQDVQGMPQDWTSRHSDREAAGGFAMG